MMPPSGEIYPIPERALARLKALYAEFEQATTLCAEAMGLDIQQPMHVDLQQGCFVGTLVATSNGQVHEEVSA